MKPGCWKTCGVFALTIVIIIGIAGYLFSQHYGKRYYQQTTISSKAELTRITGVTFPENANTWEAIGWYDNLYVIARVRFPRADLDQFLAQSASAEVSDRKGSTTLHGTLKDFVGSKDKFNDDVYHDDACTLPLGEEGIIERWKVKGIRRYLSGHGIKMKGLLRPSNFIYFQIDLDEPQMVTVYIKYDSRGGILC